MSEGRKKFNRHKLKLIHGREFKLALESIYKGKAVYETATGKIVDYRGEEIK